MKNIRSVFFVTLLLFLAGTFLRLWHLGHAAFGADNMEFYKLALQHQSIVEFWRNPPWLNQIPLNETFTLLLIKAGLPATPFVTRLPFALMGILALFFVWRFMQKRVGGTVAVAVLLLAVFNPYQLYFSRTAYHYSGAICWSAALLCAFWSLKERLEVAECPSVGSVGLWFITAVLACHMHMSVWMVAGLQGILLLGYGLWYLRDHVDRRKSFLISLCISAVVLGLLLSRWIARALQRVVGNELGGKPQVGDEFVHEVIRLLPAYFSGENFFAVLLFLLFVVLTIIALFHNSPLRRMFRSLVLVALLHLVAIIAYVAVVGGGVAKIAYFSAIWPLLILVLGSGAELGIRTVCGERRIPRMALRVLLFGGYLIFALPASWAIVNLDGKPMPSYKIGEAIQSHCPAGTPVLVDHWLAPGYELALHNPLNIQYTFTVPNMPLENYQKNHWRATAEQFFEKYPQAVLLEMRRGKFADVLGSWTFPREHFARRMTIANEAALTLRRLKVFPTADYAGPTNNGILVYVSYNTPDDLIAAARAEGRRVLRLYGTGWGYTKPGWQRGDFSDYRTFTRSATVVLHNLTDVPMLGSLSVKAASAGRPKTVSIEGKSVVFPGGRISERKVPLTLQPGENRIEFTSPIDDPLFVRDLDWAAD